MAPWITDSARRHGITDEAILHAFNLPMHVDEPDEEGFVMIIGPDQAANLLEVGVVESEDGPVIVHAMFARAEYQQVVADAQKPARDRRSGR